MSASQPDSQTYAACLTPGSTGAIASLVVYGPQAWQIVRRLIRPPSKAQQELPADPEPGPIMLARIGGEIPEQVVVTAKQVRPVPIVELHCHGGREVVRAVLELLEKEGARLCSWQDFLHLTAGDALRAAAAAELAGALTVRTASILLDQYHGAFGTAVNKLMASCEREDVESGGRLLQELQRHIKVGQRLTRPWQVVIAGAPNGGKSSLVNALAGYQRCIVSPLPGTTRDVVTTLIAVDGWPVELADTAGLRHGAGTLEQLGISSAEDALRSADLCLWVLDAAAQPHWPAFQSDSLRYVVNKIDLAPLWDLGQAAGAVHVSAKTGAGIPELCTAMAHWLVPEPPAPGAAVPFMPALGAAVEEASRLHSSRRFAAAREALSRSLELSLV
jgi:tRNA modification GTPase